MIFEIPPAGCVGGISCQFPIMKSKETIQQLFQSLWLKPIKLPTGIHIWQIWHPQVEEVIQHLGEPSKKEKNRDGGPQYSWLPNGPIIYLVPDYWGIVFECEEDLKQTLPRLSQMGMTRETSHWFIKLTGEESRQLLAKTPHEVYQSRKDEKTVYELLEGKAGYLDFWGYSRAHWFPTLSDWQKYEAQMLTIDANL